MTIATLTLKMMMIFRFKNQFLICGKLSEYNIEISRNNIKAKVSIRSNKKYYLCRFNINKEYQRQEYYNFLGTFGIPYEMIRDFDNERYTVYTQIPNSLLGGAINLKRFNGTKNPSSLLVGGNVLQVGNKTIFSAKFLDLTYKNDYEKLTVDAIYIGQNKFYNKTKGKLNILDLNMDNCQFQNGYVYQLELKYQYPYIDNDKAHNYQEPNLFIIKAIKTGHKQIYTKIKSEVLEYKREQRMIEENRRWQKRY